MIKKNIPAEAGSVRDKKTVFKVAGRIQNLPNLHTPEQRGDVIHDTRVTAAA